MDQVTSPPRPIRQFISAYVKTMRPYYSFITGIAGWIGVSFYFFVKERDCGVNSVTQADWVRGLIALTILFLSWGVNQVFNDWRGLAEDRINAPNRPMVTGELNVRWALATSLTLMGIASIVTCFLNPWALIPLLLGFVLNFVYEESKAWGIWANLVFGIMISMCMIYGFLAVGPLIGDFFTTNRVCALILVIYMNGLMTFFTYFKDYEGDKAAGKRTYIVRAGVDTARRIGIYGSLVPTILFLGMRWAGLWPFEITNEFIFCGVMTAFLQVWTAVRYYRNPIGPRSFFSLATNFRACACGQVTLIAIFNGRLAMYLFNLTYVFVGFLFGLYDDEKG